MPSNRPIPCQAGKLPITPPATCLGWGGVLGFGLGRVGLPSTLSTCPRTGRPCRVLSEGCMNGSVLPCTPP